MPDSVAFHSFTCGLLTVPFACGATLEIFGSLQHKSLFTEELTVGPTLETSRSTWKTIHVAFLWDGQGFALKSFTNWDLLTPFPLRGALKLGCSLHLEAFLAGETAEGPKGELALRGVATAHRPVLRMADGLTCHSFTCWLLIVPIPR